MANIKFKDRYGDEHIYNNINSISAKDENDNIVTFVRGQINITGDVLIGGTYTNCDIISDIISDIDTNSRIENGQYNNCNITNCYIANGIFDHCTFNLQPQSLMGGCFSYTVEEAKYYLNDYVMFGCKIDSNPDSATFTKYPSAVIVDNPFKPEIDLE